jgi:hypothetical protein
LRTVDANPLANPNQHRRRLLTGLKITRELDRIRRNQHS